MSIANEELEKLIHSLTQEAAKVLHRCGFGDVWFHYPDTNYTYNWKALFEAKNVPPGFGNALKVLISAHQVRTAIRENYSPAGLALNVADLVKQAQIAKFSYYLPDIERGQKSILSGKKGQEEAFGTKEEKEKLRDSYQKTVNQTFNKHPHLRSWKQIAELAGRKHEVSYKTIQRYTQNPLLK